MAMNQLGDLVVKLSLDAANFEDGLTRFQSKIQGVTDKFKSSASGLTDFDKATAKLKTSAETLTQRLDMQKAKVSDLEVAYKKSVAEKGADAKETQKLAKELDNACSKMEQTERALNMVNAEIKKNENGWYRLSQNLQGVGDKLQKIGKSVSDVGMKLTKSVTMPVVAMGTACIMAFTSFDDSMRQVQATMGLIAGSSAEADDSIAKLTAAAKEMGATTRFTASESAQALNYLALAGYDADQAIAALPVVLDLAAAGGMSLATASDMVTDSMAALGLNMSEMTGFTDKMAVTAQKTNTSVSQLGEAILTVGGTAKRLSGGVTEMNTALGILADAGIKGGEGGTMLRNVILSLTAPSKKAAGALKQLGVDVFDANGNMRPINETMKDLDAALGEMTTEQKSEWLSKIFNKRDLKAVEALLSNSGDKFDELSTAIEGSDGAANQMADTMEGGIGGSFRSMKSAAEGLAIAFGERLAPMIKAASEKITELTRWFTQLNPATQDTILKILGIAAAIGPVLFIVGKAISMVGTITKGAGVLIGVISGTTQATGALGAVISFLSGPIGWIIIGITALVAAFIYFWNTNEVFREKVTEIWNGIVNVFKRAFSAISGWWTNNDVTGKITAGWNAVKSGVGAVFNWYFGAYKAAFGAVKNWWTNNDVTQKISGAWETAKSVISAVWGELSTVAQTAAQGVSEWWGDTGAPALQAGWDTAKGIMTEVWNGLSTAAETAANNISAWWNDSGAASEFSAAWETAKGAVSTIWDSFSTAASGAVSSIVSAWNGAEDGSKFSAAWEAAKAVVSGVWETISGVIQNIANAFTGINWSLPELSLPPSIQFVWDAINTAWQNIKSAFSGIAWSLPSLSVPPSIQSAWDTISGIATNLKNAFAGIKWSLPPLKLPHVKVSWSDIGMGISIPSFGIDWYAKGGVFTSPTIFGTGTGFKGVGEAGAEAVLPLDTLWDEMSMRLRTGMRNILEDYRRADEQRDYQMRMLSRSGNNQSIDYDRLANAISQRPALFSLSGKTVAVALAQDNSQAMGDWNERVLAGYGG